MSEVKISVGQQVQITIEAGETFLPSQPKHKVNPYRNALEEITRQLEMVCAFPDNIETHAHRQFRLKVGEVKENAQALLTRLDKQAEQEAAQ